MPKGCCRIGGTRRVIVANRGCDEIMGGIVLALPAADADDARQQPTQGVTGGS
jgi:hypothetical protein